MLIKLDRSFVIRLRMFEMLLHQIVHFLGCRHPTVTVNDNETDYLRV
ncbi:MAG: hypothetical protein RR182_01130 [Alistipes sp.]